MTELLLAASVVPSRASFAIFERFPQSKETSEQELEVLSQGIEIESFALRFGADGYAG